jgi:hypothetical protein
MATVALNRRNRIAEILEDRSWSIYRLAQKMNEIKPADFREIQYRTVWNIVNSDTIPPRTNYVNVLLIADALGVSVDTLEQREAA